MFSCFLDWCPRATHALEPIVYRYENAGLLDDLTDYFRKQHVDPHLVRTYVDAITCAYRTDGLFIFAISWKNDGPHHITVEFNIACVVAHYIKTKIGHTHIFDSGWQSASRMQHWLPLNKMPVKVSVSSADLADVAALIASDERLLDLSSDHVPFRGTGSGPQMPAVLRLREKYSRMFDLTFNWIRSVKSVRYMGAPIYQRTGLMFVVYLVLIFAYSVHHVHQQRYPDTHLGLSMIAGTANTACIWLLIATVSALARKYIGTRPTEFVARLRGQMRVRAFSEWFYRLRRLRIHMSRAEIVVISFILGPLLFSLREIPTFFDLAKLFKSSLTKEWVLVLENAVNGASIADALTSGNLARLYIEDLAFWAPLLLCIIYAIQVSLKRRKVIRALSQLSGFLEFGNIFNAVIESAYLRGRKTQHVSFDFTSARNISLQALAVEQRKRLETQCQLLLVAAACIAFSWDRYMQVLRHLGA